jgi:hypothetical protein
MRRIAVSLVAATIVAGTPLAGVALGATGKAKPWQADAGRTKTKAAACKLVSEVKAKPGFSGYAVEVERRGQFSKGMKFEVEKGFATQKRAKAEVARLHKAGLKGSVENERSEKGTAGAVVSCT